MWWQRDKKYTCSGVEFCSNDWKCMICYIIGSLHRELSLSNAKYVSLYIYLDLTISNPVSFSYCDYSLPKEKKGKGVFAK